MMSSIGRGLLLFGLLLTATAASAEMPLKVYLENKNDEVTQYYLVGIAKGVFWASSGNFARRQTHIMCLPEKTNFNSKLIQSLFENRIQQRAKEGRPYGDNDLIEMIMTSAILDAFPCPPTSGQAGSTAKPLP